MAWIKLFSWLLVPASAPTGRQGTDGALTRGWQWLVGTQRACGQGREVRLITARPSVFFDGGCPICSREIKFYQGREGSEAFDWIDVTRTDDGMLGPGLSRNAALARLHVRRADGKVVSGAAAFAEIWRGLPGLRWLGRLLAVPPFGALAEFGYWLFLHLRKLRR